jgi:deazaflavin-dependent oxidoreductase (nitroreductase family)
MSVKVPPPGTHGAEGWPSTPEQAVGWSKAQQKQFREHGGGRTQGGIHTLLLETVGAKSGEPRVAMLGFVEEAPNAWLVIGSMSGQANHPAWVYNLAKRPQATVELPGGTRLAVEAETLDGPELEAAWQLIGREAPEYPKYRSQTDRELPVVRLRARPPGGTP